MFLPVRRVLECASFPVAALVLESGGPGLRARSLYLLRSGSDSRRRQGCRLGAPLGIEARRGEGVRGWGGPAPVRVVERREEAWELGSRGVGLEHGYGDRASPSPRADRPRARR